MNIRTTYLLRLLGVFLLIASTQGHAIPTLFFHGSSDFDAASGLLNIDATLTGAVDIAPAPTLAGSSLTLQALLNSSSSSAFITAGFFGTGLGAPDLSIVDGGPITLLEGEILDLIMAGPNGLDFGVLTGNFTSTAGSLLGDFTDPSGIFALEFNLTTVFGSTMFDSNFSGQADGRISSEVSLDSTAVPEPNTLVLLAMGLFGLVANRKFLVRTKLRKRKAQQ